MDSVKILALSGSLRKESYNTAIIKALKIVAPSQIDIKIGSISELPLFNPDLNELSIPALVQLTAQLKASDGLIIASPEYAHGISGPMKNALDWLVSGEEFPFKPIMLINTSPRAFHAQNALKEVLTTMSGQIVENAHLTIPLMGSGLDVDGIVKDQDFVGLLKSGLLNFCEAIKN